MKQEQYPLIPAESGIQFGTERNMLWIPNQVWDERKINVVRCPLCVGLRDNLTYAQSATH